jgi:hypothetical protein
MNIDEKGKWRTPGKKDKLRRRKETQDRKREHQGDYI